MLNGIVGELTATFEADFTFAAYPRLRDGYSLPPRWKGNTPGGRSDALVLTAAVSDYALALALKNVADPLIPVVSLVPDTRAGIDAAGAGEHAAWERAREIQARLRK